MRRQPDIVHRPRRIGRQAIVTGNAPGGLSFRGSVGYTSENDFRGGLPSDPLYTFERERHNDYTFGITRASVMELARAEGIDCVERDLSVEELLSADEVFLTATSIGVWPVVAIDDQGYGNGAMGPVTAQLQARHRRIVTGEDPKFAHWLTVCG